MKKRFLTLILTLTAMLMLILGLSACKGESGIPNGGLDNKVNVELTKENLATYIDVDEEIDGRQVHLVPSMFPIYYYMYVNPSINVIATPIEEDYVCQDVEITVEVTYMCYRWNESDLDIDHSQYQTEQFTIKASETGSGSVRVLSKKNSYVQQYYITMASATVKSVKGNIWVDCVHEWDGGTITIPATCTETGIKTIKCGRCEKIKEEILPSLGHDYPEEGTLVTEATCTINGKKEYVCERCDNVKSETIAMLGHDYPEEGTVVQEATCLMTGKERFICSRCEVTKEETIAALGHSWETTWSKDDTYHWIECNICDAKKDKSIHNYGDNALCSVCGQQDNASQGVEYKLSESGMYYVLWSVGECSDANVIIASSYNGKPVKTISESAFYENTTMTSVTIPQSITKIEPWAFYGCTSLTSITISDNVTSIGESAFQNCNAIQELNLGTNLNVIEKNAFKNCSALKDIAIPENVTTIGEGAFNGCSGLTSATIPNSVNSIGFGAFSGCNSLTEITLPFVGETKNKNTYFGYIFGASSYSYNNSYVPTSLNKVTITGGSIGSSAFYGCGGLISIEIGDGVTSIGNKAFDNCSSLESFKVDIKNTSYASEGGVLYNKQKTQIVSVPLNIKMVIIPDGVNSIADNTFENCSNLTSVVIPDSVTSIGGKAFYNCNSLTEMTLPFVGESKDAKEKSYSSAFGYIFGGVTSSSSDPINGATYQGNRYGGYYHYYIPTSLTEVTITGGDIIYSAFYNCSSLTSVTIGNNVTSIDNYAFYKCSSLISVEIGDGVENIGEYAFYNCSNLTDVEIPDSVTSIGYSAFYDCSSLTSVVIGNSVTSIGERAFSNCSSLTSVEIGEGVASVGENAFSRCSNLTDLYITDIAAWCNISGINNLMSYGSSAKYLYLNNELVTKLEIPNTITEIKAYAFSNCSSLTSVEMPNSVTSVGFNAFSGCGGLTSVEIGNSVESIDNYAFYYCSSLTEIVIPNSISSIGTYTFAYCTRLIKVVIGNGVTSIGYRPFYECSKLEYEIKDELKYLGNKDNPYLFLAGTTSKEITSATIDNACRIVDYSCLKECRSLTYVKIGDGVTSIDSWAFAYHSDLTTVVIGDSVTTIGNGAFDNCSSLKSVGIGKGVTSIGSGAFSECRNLTSILIRKTVTSVGEQAFYRCDRLTINCEVGCITSEWHSKWNDTKCPISWVHISEN